MAAWTARFISQISNGPSSVHFFRSQFVPVDRVPTTGGLSTASCMCSSPAVTGRIYHLNMACRPPCGGASNAGARRGVGAPLACCARGARPAGQLDWSIPFLDGSFAPAKKGGAKVGVTKQGKGTK
jgi:hypothetical protein